MAREVVIADTATVVPAASSLPAVLGVGAFVGFFGWALTVAINSWVLNPVFCRSADTAAACSSAGLTAWIIAHIIISVIGLFMLIRANVFRPLLVVLAALATLWIIGLWFIPSVWWVGLIWETVLFALAYALYTWIASAKNFIFSLVAIIVLVIVFRLIIAL